MSETVAVALITGGLVALSSLITQGMNTWLDQGRRRHEAQQLTRQLNEEREMRVLEWRRADRLERLAPVREFLDALSREAVVIGAAALEVARAKRSGQDRHEIDRHESCVQQCKDRLARFLQEKGQARFRISDPQLDAALWELMEWITKIVAANDVEEDVGATLAAPVKRAWDRLEQLQTAL
jgi:hypothetical protein